MDKFDVVVIGGGPGGYVAAIRCSQLGNKVAVIDKWLTADGKPSLGGTCLNVGCIPSKAMLDSSHHYHRLQHEFSRHGINVKNVSLDIKQMLARKEEVCRTLTGGIAMLFTKHKITWLQGHGSLLPDRKVEFVSHQDGKKKPAQTIEAEHIIIATGSVPAEAAETPFDGKFIVDSTGALNFDQVPKRLAVIGGGVIGLELSSVWSRLGSEVSIFIRREQFLPNVDQQLADAAHKILSTQGLDIRLGARPVSAKVNKNQVTLHYQEKGEDKKQNFDRVLVAAGRKPNTDGLNATAAGLQLDDRGFIEVDELCRTNLAGIYAIGDVVRGPMLAHKASEEGVAVAEHIAGQAGHVNYATIPWIIYTWPEMAWVGKTSQELRTDGIDFKEGVFPFNANGRAHAMGDPAGMVKIISDVASDRILGVHILGANASELIAEAVVAMEFQASAEDLARIVHAHPTLSEAVHEAALGVDKRSLHR